VSEGRRQNEEPAEVMLRTSLATNRAAHIAANALGKIVDADITIDEAKALAWEALEQLNAVLEENL
jgi:hypothetical protein